MSNRTHDEQALRYINLLQAMGLSLKKIAELSGYDLTSISHVKNRHRQASRDIANILRLTLAKVKSTVPVHVLATCNDPDAAVNDAVRTELATVLWTRLVQTLNEWRHFPHGSAESACKVDLPEGYIGVTARVGNAYILAADSGLPDQNQRRVIGHESNELRRLLCGQISPNTGPARNGLNLAF